MAGDAFNGATISFAAANQIPLRSITHDDSAAEINVTGSADVLYTYEAGISNPSTTYEIVGGTSVTTGTKGAIVVAWNDVGSSTDGSITNAVITKVSTTGSLDGEITSSITARPSTA